MAIGKTQVALLRKMIKRQNQPRRKLRPKTVTAAERPQYFRSPVAPPEPPLTLAEMERLHRLVYFGATRNHARSAIIAARHKP